MKIFDISRALSNDLAPWPGDTPFHFELKWKMAEGATVNVGAINMGVHNGTHADATFHFDEAGEPIERMPLDAYVGDAVVVDLTELFAGARDEVVDRTRQIGVTDLEAFSDSLEQASRLLLKTGVWKDSKVFPDWIPVMAPDVPAWLRERKVKLIGLDLPSVDPIEAKKLTNHYALAAAGVAIVESLDLSEVEAGIYHFSALPLKIAGGDAGPVRAILWRD
ncbi:MAG TPA: cyclase family protein [Chthoniobacterales bacterium]|nr:cyclase family protein [Chthoniobacterales bacterium]